MHCEDGGCPGVSHFSTSVCAICLKPSTYVCPRCSINYCSITCYRDYKHSRCSEAFYRDCCINSLRGAYVSSSSKRSMVEILRRQTGSEMSPENDEPIVTDVPDFLSESPGSMEDNDIDELLNRFSDLGVVSEDAIDRLDAETIWSRLTIKQRRDFHRWVSSNTVMTSLRLWEPWWRQKVEEVDTSYVPTTCCSTPGSDKFTDGVKTLTQLLPSGKSPHVSVVFSLCELLLGYAFVCRRYNGDHQALALDSFSTLCQIVASLSGDAGGSKTRHPVEEQSKRNVSEFSSRTVILSNYTSVTHPAPVYTTLSQVLASVQQKLCNAHLPCSPQMMILLLEDVDTLLQGQCAANIRRALSDSQNLVNVALKEVEAGPISPQLKAAQRKLVFLQACMHPLDISAIKWQRASLPKLCQLVTVELCNQLVSDSSGRDGELLVPTVAAGSNWCQMIRDKQPTATVVETMNHNSLIVPMDNV